MFNIGINLKKYVAYAITCFCETQHLLDFSTCCLRYGNGSYCLMLLDVVAHGKHNIKLLCKFNFTCLLKKKVTVSPTYDARVVSW